MATQASLDRVQELYVAYYGRPADQAGQEYWADRLDDEGEGAIINAFGNSAEYDELSEGQGNATLVDNLYQQMFGRSADPEGLTYYTGVLESGDKTLAQIAVTILNAASGEDRNDFNAKVEAAAEYTETYGSADDYDVVAGKDAVDSAKGGLYTPELTPSIEDYQDAKQAVSDYLQDDVVAVKAVADELPTGVKASDATDTQIENALGSAVTAAKSDVGTAGSISLDSNPSIAAAQIDAKQAALEKTLDTAQDTVNDTDGLNAAITSLQGAETRYESALKTEISTDKALDAEAAKFDSLNSLTVTVNPDGTIDDASGGAVIEEGSNGELVVTDAYADADGVDALLSASQAQFDAAGEVDTQKAAFEKAIDKVVETETDSSYTVNGSEYTISGSDVTVNLTGTADDAQGLIDAQEALSTFNDAVADYQSLTGLQDQVDDLNEAVGDAQDAIEEQGVVLNTTTSADAVGGDAENDLFIFDAEAGDQTISDFGVDGEDQIYVGNSFTAVNLELDAGDTLDTTDQGDVNTLEVFFQQSGNDTVLSFENKAFAGSAENGFDGTEITLTGVNADDLQLENGYVSIA